MGALGGASGVAPSATVWHAWPTSSVQVGLRGESGAGFPPCPNPASNTIVTRCQVSSTLTLGAVHDVTFREVYINVAGYWLDARNATDVVVEDSDWYRGTAQPPSSGFTVRRNWIHRTPDLLTVGCPNRTCESVLIEDNYMAGMSWTDPAVHADGIQDWGGTIRNLTIRHNYIDAGNANGCVISGVNTCNAALFLSDAQHVGTVVIESNLFRQDGAIYQLRLDGKNVSQTGQTYVVNNMLVDNDNSGTSAYTRCWPSIVLWQGNVRQRPTGASVLGPPGTNGVSVLACT